jgi:hypothetical protein
MIAQTHRLTKLVKALAAHALDGRDVIAGITTSRAPPPWPRNASTARVNRGKSHQDGL